MVPFSLETLGVIFPYAVIMAGVGLTEGLLTLNLVDEMTGTKGNSNRECVAQEPPTSPTGSSLVWVAAP